MISLSREEHFSKFNSLVNWCFSECKAFFSLSQPDNGVFSIKSWEFQFDAFAK
jgi:hypothetical protein